MSRKSTGEYPDDWDEIATRTKYDANWKCVRCGHAHAPERGYMLTVHHIDLDKSNCEWWNLAALCQRCHLSIQAKVNIHQIWMFTHSDWFKPYVAGYYAHHLGIDGDRQQITEQADSIIWMATQVEYAEMEAQ